MLDLDPTRQRQPDVTPPPVQSTEGTPRLTTMLAGLLVLLAGVATLTVFFLAKAKATELLQLDSQYETLAAQLESPSLQAIGERAIAVSKKSQLFLKAAAVPDRWLILLEELQSVTSPGVQLLSLSMDQRNLIRIEGSTTSHELVASLLATLEASEKFENVTLVAVTAHDEAPSASVQFTIGVSFVEPTSS